MNPKGFQLILTKLLGNQDTKALAMLSKHHLDTMKTPKSLLEEKKNHAGYSTFCKTSN